MNDHRNAQPLVLVIDDDPQTLREVATALGAANLTCRCCRSPREAIDAAAEASPALIVCDVHLDGESGLETCQRIRQQPGLQRVPVMFLSGAQLPDIIRRSHAVGGTYYLRKPFDPGVLVELVDKALWMPQLAEDRARQRQTTAGAC